MFWFIIMGFVLAAIPLSWLGALTYSSVQPRLAHRRQLLHADGKTRKARREREERELVLDEALKQLAFRDVRKEFDPSRSLEDYLPSDFELTHTDMDYVNENYSKHVEQEMGNHLEKSSVKDSVDMFDDIRRKHRETIQRVRKEHQRILEQSKDPYAEEFAHLEESSAKTTKTKEVK